MKKIILSIFIFIFIFINYNIEVLQANSEKLPKVSVKTVKKEYKNYLKNRTGDYTGNFNLEYIARIKKSFKIDSINKLNLLDPYHHWEKGYLIERFNFRPKKPLYCYLLEIQKIKFPKNVAYNIHEAKGCISWFKLNEPIQIDNTLELCNPIQEKELLRILDNF